MLESVEVKQGTRYIKESWLLAAEEFFFNAFGRRGEWHRCSSLQQFETTHDDSHDCLSSLHSSPNVKEEPEHTGEVVACSLLDENRRQPRRRSDCRQSFGAPPYIARAAISRVGPPTLHLGRRGCGSPGMLDYIEY